MPPVAQSCLRSDPSFFAVAALYEQCRLENTSARGMSTTSSHEALYFICEKNRVCALPCELMIYTIYLTQEIVAGTAVVA